MAKVGEIFVELGIRDNLSKPAKDAEKAVQSLGKGTASLKPQANQAAQAITIMEGRLSQAGLQAHSARGAMLNFSRVVQDAPFGIMGVANNIDPLIDSFQRLSSRAGGAAGAMRAMLSTLAGPAGIALAVSAATSAVIAFGPKLAEFFNSAEAGAKKFRDAMLEALDSLVSLKDVTGEFEITGAQAAIIAGGIEEELISLREKEREILRDQANAASALASFRHEELETTQAQIKNLESEQQFYKDILARHNALINASSRLQEHGLKRSDNEIKIANALDLQSAAMEEQREIAFDLAEQAERRAERREARRKALFGGAESVPGLPDDPIRSIDQLITRADILEGIGTRAFQSLSQAIGMGVQQVLLMDDAFKDLGSTVESFARILKSALANVLGTLFSAGIFAIGGSAFGLGSARSLFSSFLGIGGASPSAPRASSTVIQPRVSISMGELHFGLEQWRKERGISS